MTTLGGQPVTIHHGEAVHPPTALLGLDVESTYMDDRGQFGPGFRVRTVQFATTTEAWVFDLANGAERTMAEACFLDDRVTFVSHSNMDVLAVHAEFGIDISERNMDTHMLATQAYPAKGSDRGLKALAAEHGMPELAEAEAELKAWMRDEWVAIGGGKRNASKAAVETFGWNYLAEMASECWPEVFIRYAGLDAIACRRLADILPPLTKAPAPLVRVDQWAHVRTNRIQIRGLRLDREQTEKLHDESSSAFTAAKVEAEGIAGVNVNGPKILGWLAEHGADWDTWPGTRTPTGAPSLAKENIGLLSSLPLDEDGRRVAALLAEQQRHADMKTKTGEILRRAVWDGEDWRIHPLLNPVGASTTARMSSSAPNVQNFSKKNPLLRGVFLFDRGTTGATIDFKQVELRVVAALAREEKMIETIKAGGDLHDLTVDELAAAGVTITRNQAKTVNFLIVYGGGAFALNSQTGIPMDEAKNIIQTWRERYKSITALSQYLGMERHGLRTVSGRYLPVTRTKAGDVRSYANINYATQSAARELLLDGWIRFADIRGRDGMVWLPIHDELVLQIPEGMEAEVMADAEKAMTMEFRGVPIEADAIVLRDRDGISRWMTGDLAEEIAREKAA